MQASWPILSPSANSSALGGTERSSLRARVQCRRATTVESASRWAVHRAAACLARSGSRHGTPPDRLLLGLRASDLAYPGCHASSALREACRAGNGLRVCFSFERASRRRMPCPKRVKAWHPNRSTSLGALCDLCGNLPFSCILTQSDAFLPAFSVFSVAPW